MNKKTKPTLELTVEFAIELLLVFIPYGADQMGIPHNFWVGLTCWILGAAIAIRMFWIFPWWSHRTNLEKGLILFILLAVITYICYKPVMTAYNNRNGTEEAKSTVPPVQAPVQPPVQPPTQTPPPSQGTATPPSIEIPPTVAPIVKAIPGARPLDDNKQGQLINSFPMSVSYNCIGQKTESRSASDKRAIGRATAYPKNKNSDERASTSNAEVDSLIQMENLNNAKDYSGLLQVCHGKINSAPQWLTPYLFCSLGYLSSGNTAKAKELLDKYNRMGGFSRDEPCKQVYAFLHGHL